MTKESTMHVYVNWAKSRLDEMDATLAAFESKVGNLQADARSNAEKALAVMRTKRAAFRDTIAKDINFGEAAWTKTQAHLKTDWQAFEANTKAYIHAAGDLAEHQQAAFRARAEAQRKAWHDAVEGIQKATAQFSSERKKDFDAVLKRVHANIDAAKTKLDGLSRAGSQSWSALEKALAETRTAFDHANKTVHEALRRNSQA